jgi:SusD family.
MKRINIFLCAISVVCGFSACSDFFDQSSDQVIFTDTEHLSQATDTMYSVTGIINKLQAIADRTILLGEARGDLVDVTNVTNSDLRDVAFFNIGDDNRYNQPSDYYAIINNCNYYIAHADTALKNNRNEYIFQKEYAAVKAIRAWTYLQLVINYGSVPFVIEPILTKQEAEAQYPFYGIEDVCSYFIDDLLPLAERYKREYPAYGNIASVDSKLLWYPINIVLGDLYLWKASVSPAHSQADYRNAALRYYKYLSERNGDNSYYPVGLNMITWSPGTTDWDSSLLWGSVSNFYQERNEKFGDQNEVITLIPGDSLRSDKNYSQLRNIFNSREENDYRVSLVPSNSLINLVESQEHCVLSSDGRTAYYSQKGLSEHRTGDLRLGTILSDQGYHIDRSTNERIETQFIDKYDSKNIHVYRRTQVYLRLAEALNGGGFPRMAFDILATGLNDQIMSDTIAVMGGTGDSNIFNVYQYLTPSDSAWASQIYFPSSRYDIFTEEHMINNRTTGYINTMGIHSRGSGWTPMNEYYRLPEDTLLTEDQLRPIQQAYVDSLILNENALEMCFEGTRFYDLMRYALRQSNPGQVMAKYVYGRRGEENRAIMRSEIKKNLEDQANWFLKWNGKIGF